MAKVKYGRLELLRNPRVYKTWDPNWEPWDRLAFYYELSQNESPEEDG